MKLSHINNVVLYANNWYVHTGDIVRDMQKHILVDHPGADVSTKGKIREIMVRDRNEWVDSLNEKTDHINIDYLKDKEKKFGVAWENDKDISQIWACICEYSSFIGNYFDGLKPPVYDRNRGLIPQKNLQARYDNPWVEARLPLDATDSDYEKAAVMFMSKSMETVLSELCDRAISLFDYVKCLNIISIKEPKYLKNQTRTFKWIRKCLLVLKKDILSLLRKPHRNFEFVNRGLFCATVYFGGRNPEVTMFVVPLISAVNGMNCISADDMFAEHSSIIKYCADVAISNIDFLYCRQLFDTDDIGSGESVEEHLKTIYECAVPYEKLIERCPDVETDGSMTQCGLFTIEANFDGKHGVRLSLHMCESYGFVEGIRNSDNMCVQSKRY